MRDSAESRIRVPAHGATRDSLLARILAAMLLRRAVVLLALLTAAAPFASCGGDDDTTVGTPEATATRERPAYTGPTTGVPQLDQVIATAVTGTDIDLAAITGYSHLACEAAPAEGSPGPACRASEDPGTEVEVLPVINCVPALVRPEQVPDAFREALSGDRALAAAYEPKPDVFGLTPEYVAVIGAGSTGAAALYVRDGRVVAIETPCRGDAAALTAAERIARSLYAAP